MSWMNSMRGRRAVVTGAASGIGRALATLLAARGQRLLLGDLDGPRVSALAAVLGAASVTGDVRDPGFFVEVAETMPDPHLVCLNAGVVGESLGHPWDVPAQEWIRVFEVNVRGVLNGLAEFVPRMLASGEDRSLLITGSLAGLVTFPSGGAYAASKHALTAVTEQTALALAGSRVRVTLLCPALVRTAMSDVGVEPEIIAGEALDAVARGVFAAVPQEWKQAVRDRGGRLSNGLPPSLPTAS
jgi:NAD(P)-dependent dehydrogenase (short-subunit alcohol dehydrogenase family)